MSLSLYTAHSVRPAYGRAVERKTNRLYQTSTMTALLSAVYDSETTMAKLLEHGDSRAGVGGFPHDDPAADTTLRAGV
jgi:Alpha-acetolactate decarboxylase